MKLPENLTLEVAKESELVKAAIESNSNYG